MLFKATKTGVICDTAAENSYINHIVNLFTYLFVSILTYGFLFFTVIIYFDAHIVPDLTSVNPFSRASVSF